MHFWEKMAQGVSSLAIKQLTWILVCWGIISPRFEKRKKFRLRRNRFHQQRRGEKTPGTCCLFPPAARGPLACLPITLSELMPYHFGCIYWLEAELATGRRRQWQLTPVLLPWRSHGWRSLVGCSPWDRYKSDTTSLSLSCIGEEMATHSSILAWSIPGTGEPGGLPSMGSHRIGHDWSDLAAAATVQL